MGELLMPLQCCYPRISVFKKGDGSRKISTTLLVTHKDFADLCEDIAKRLDIRAVSALHNNHGARISDLNVLRDNDVIYATEDDVAGDVPCLKETRPGIWIRLNVGGQLFSTTKATLTQKEPGSMLARMFSNEQDNHWLSCVDESGAYLIDRNGAYFAPILDYLRHGELVLDKSLNPAGVLEEAKFYGLTSIIPQLENMIQACAKPSDYTPITRRELALSLMSTPAVTLPLSSELRCQGLNFSGADVSRMDLRFVNFKYADFSNANLSGANLSNANFERADLTNAILDGANLMGAKLLCAQLEGASMKGCNFEDPAGTRANMEGANMKHVNLEGSHMAGVNLRVANLKNSNLQNCDLRGAVLAGADLENCDLSGCDLQEANLRGANLEGAAFAMMLNALHMSQTLKS